MHWLTQQQPLTLHMCFYCNHVSLWGSDSCAAADFRVLPVETTQCEDEAQSREHGQVAMHDAADFRHIYIYIALSCKKV